MSITNNTEVIVLGCGDAFSSGGLLNSNYLICGAGTTLLVDCGVSILTALHRQDLAPMQIDEILITHFHGDHYGGIPFFLLSSLYQHPRQKPLIIRGPEGLQQRCRELSEALYAGSWEKFGSLSIQWLEYSSNREVETNWGKLLPIPVEHSPASRPHGLRLSYNHKVLAFSGDTAWHPKLVKLASQSHLFICECNFYHTPTSGHLNYQELKKNAAKLNTDQIWLTHLGNEMLQNKTRVALAMLSEGQRILLTH